MLPAHELRAGPVWRSCREVVGELLLLLSKLAEKHWSLSFLHTWHCLLAALLTRAAPFGFLQNLQSQAAALLARDPSPDRQTIRGAISGNLCRCTGYQAIVDAIETVTKSVGNDD